MRMLHTSDWHLGRRFHRVGLLDAQAVFIDHLVEVVRSEDVALVVLAGDVYDRAIPPVEAVTLLDEALSRIRGAGATVVAISGNHDSVRRLGFGSRLLSRAGVHLRTDPSTVPDPVLVTDRDVPVAVYAVPYLEPAVVPVATFGTRGPETTAPAERGPRPGHEEVLGAALRAIRRDAAARPGMRTVVTAHAVVAGSAASDSERDISVAGVGAVDDVLFDGIDYVALGHLHRPQVVRDPIRYSGSPLAYSFSEHGQTKGSWLVDLGADARMRTEFVPAPVPRPLAVLRGELSRVLADPALAVHEDSWCQITLTDRHRPARAMPRIRERFPHTVELRFEPADPRHGGTDSYLSRIRGRADLEICTGFVDHVRTRPASRTETEWFRQALRHDRLQRAETTDPLPDTGPAAVHPVPAPERP
jgi:exonuclease SbcD